MKNVQIIKTNSLFLEEVKANYIEFTGEDYLLRISLLIEAMEKKNIDCAVIYGDREHFANIEYFTGYDCRFEESLFFVNREGKCTIVVGNEGMGASYKIPYEINRVLYQNFSLQGQPREKNIPINELFKICGIKYEMKVGVIGYKYMESNLDGNPDYIFDIPAYLLDALKSVAGDRNVINFTKAVTGVPDGIRMVVRNAKEIAWAEYTGNKTAGVIQRLFKNIRPGISELELSSLGNADFTAINTYPLVNFGSEHVGITLREPNDRILDVGEVCGLCYSVRGSLTARVGVAAYDIASYKPELHGSIEDYYMIYWKAVAAWYENVRVGARAGDVYEAVMDLIGDERFNVMLNTGHHIGGDEWSNSPFCKDSDILIKDGSHLQGDIIASSSNPVRVAICEDGVVIAGKGHRDELACQYPDVWDRIIMRQEIIRKHMGINLSDDVLPLSNLNCVYFPFMLNTGYIFGLR